MNSMDSDAKTHETSASDRTAAGNPAMEEPVADLTQNEQEKAAETIQRNYRGYRTRRQLRGMGLSPSTRWSEAVKDLQFQEWTKPRSREEELNAENRQRAKKNWKRAGAVAARAVADDSDDETEVEECMSPEDLEEHRRAKQKAKAEREETAKQMGLDYWLELVDTKHRYGSHLRKYHQVWRESGTHENFFYWLDFGEGKDFELELVPRERLDAHRVRYLSREERQNYLVTIDKEGRLCWASNGMRITTSTAFRDSLEGIVPRDDVEHQPWASPVENLGTFSSDDASSTMSTGNIDEPEADHYVNHDLNKAKGLQKLKRVSADTILNHLLRKSVKPNTWIYVADTSFRLYVGIKQSGYFQHSSFLHGSRISSAGLIKIKDGQLRKLSPLSGHYKPPTKNFRVFVHSLRDAGVDMSRVSISRSYAILVGLDMYVQTRKKVKHGVKQVEERKDKILNPEEVKKKEEESKDKSKSAEIERQFLEKQRQEQEEFKRRNSLPYRVVNKIRTRTSIDASSEESKSPTSSSGSPAAGTPLTTMHEDIESGTPSNDKR